MKDARNDFDGKDRKTWIFDHMSQSVQVISQIFWVGNVAHCIKQQQTESQSLFYCYNYNNSSLLELVELIKQPQKPNNHRVLVSLITQEVHNRDILEHLTLEQISSESHFFWVKQLRLYWDESDSIVMRQINGTIKYGYEYIGVTTRLVITPLTDRCWITITNSLSIKLGSSMQGPAGTGKTESVKDLAK